jgi:hypothetical protein
VGVCGTNESIGVIYRIPGSVPTCWRGGIRGRGVTCDRHVVGRPTSSTQLPLPSVEYPYPLPPRCSRQVMSKSMPKWGQVAMSGPTGRPSRLIWSGLRSTCSSRVVQGRGGTSFGFWWNLPLWSLEKLQIIF